jgi:hypothetical protein
MNIYSTVTLITMNMAVHSSYAATAYQCSWPLPDSHCYRVCHLYCCSYAGSPANYVHCVAVCVATVPLAVLAPTKPDTTTMHTACLCIGTLQSSLPHVCAKTSQRQAGCRNSSLLHECAKIMHMPHLSILHSKYFLASSWHATASRACFFRHCRYASATCSSNSSSSGSDS